MFWSKNKTVKVVVQHPLQLSMNHVIPPQTQQPPTENTDTSHFDTSIKILTAIFIVAQAWLMIYGYAVLVGQYDQYGININELEISKPALMLWGYVYTLTGTLDAANKYQYAGPIALLMIVIGATFLFLRLAMRPASNETRLITACLAGVILFLIWLAPIFALVKGQNESLKEFSKYTNIPTKENLNAEHTITTDDKRKLTGMLIVAGVNSTFLLVGEPSTQPDSVKIYKVIKINNSNNKVMREISLTTKESSHADSISTSDDQTSP